jgi:hypothetical protein
MEERANTKCFVTFGRVLMLETGRADAPITIAAHEKGVAIFHAAKEGLAWETSPDGVRWQAANPEAGDAGPLRPICSAERPGESQLLCSDPEGRMMGVAAGDRRLSLNERFRPEFTAEPWYERLSAPGEMTILHDEAQSVYRAFFSARRKIGRDPERRGCIGSATSPDLRTWSTEPPIFAPNLFSDLVAPRIFSDGGRHVLFYATPEQGGLLGLRFAIAPHLEGPYERLEPDLVACDARTAVHAVRLGAKRLVFFGRAEPVRPGGAALSRPGLLEFHADGRPFVRFYDALLGLLGRTIFQTEAALNSGEILVRVLPRFGTDFRMTLKVRSRGARALAVLFRTTMTGHDNVALWLDFAAGAVLLRRGVSGRLLARTPRPLAAGEEHRVSLWVEGGFADVYLDDEWVLSCATEGRKSGGFGLATLGGEARFDAVTAQAIQAP